MKQKYFALNPDGDIVFVGEYDDFGDAADAHPEMIWIVDESSARDWLLSLLILNKDHNLGVSWK